VVALGIDLDGTKHPLALVEGASETATLARELLVGLRERGLDVTRPVLCVIDGARALRRAVTDVFDHPVIARCQQHKIRINRPWGAGSSKRGCVGLLFEAA
jgi:putative transposase